MSMKMFLPGGCDCLYVRTGDALDAYGQPATILMMCPVHSAAPDLLAACKAVEKAHIKRTSTFLLPYCVLCGRVQPQGPAEYDDRHEDGCPMPQVQAAIARDTSPQAR